MVAARTAPVVVGGRSRVCTVVAAVSHCTPDSHPQAGTLVAGSTPGPAVLQTVTTHAFNCTERVVPRGYAYQLPVPRASRELCKLDLTPLGGPACRPGASPCGVVTVTTRTKTRSCDACSSCRACGIACASPSATACGRQSATGDACGLCVDGLNGSVNGACASGPRHDSLSESGETCNDSNTQCIPLQARAPLFLKTVAHRSSRGGADAAARGSCGAIVAGVG